MLGTVVLREPRKTIVCFIVEVESFCFILFYFLFFIFFDVEHNKKAKEKHVINFNKSGNKPKAKTSMRLSRSSYIFYRIALTRKILDFPQVKIQK